MLHVQETNSGTALKELSPAVSGLAMGGLLVGLVGLWAVWLVATTEPKRGLAGEDDDDLTVGQIRRKYRDLRDKAVYEACTSKTEFDRSVAEVLAKSKSELTPENWLAAAKRVQFCRRCVGTGDFITCVVNGKPSGPGGQCFRCKGKGYQEASDFIRNWFYDIYGRELGGVYSPARKANGLGSPEDFHVRRASTLLGRAQRKVNDAEKAATCHTRMRAVIEVQNAVGGAVEQASASGNSNLLKQARSMQDRVNRAGKLASGTCIKPISMGREVERKVPPGRGSPEFTMSRKWVR